MPKDLYSTLGVTRTESLHGIRDAFRKLAKRYHPDHAGQRGTPKFQEILNAYTVLSEPEKRKRYNDSLARRSSDSEPIIISRRSSSITRPPHFGPIPQEPPFRRFSAESFFGPGWEGPAFDSLDFTVSLSPTDATEGATIWLPLPIRYLCPACSGPADPLSVSGVQRDGGTVALPLRLLPADRGDSSRTRVSLPTSTRHSVPHAR